jgi:hypothetical protein
VVFIADFSGRFQGMKLGSFVQIVSGGLARILAVCRNCIEGRESKACWPGAGAAGRDVA